jgi:L-alanine-DL-glutamate epimerase-like enolase superfamily enzyme
MMSPRFQGIDFVQIETGVHDLHVHLLAAVPNASFLEAHGFGLERFLKEPLPIIDGYATAPDRDGHGVEFDWEQLSHHRG